LGFHSNLGLSFAFILYVLFSDCRLKPSTANFLEERTMKKIYPAANSSIALPEPLARSRFAGNFS